MRFCNGLPAPPGIPIRRAWSAWGLTKFPLMTGMDVFVECCGAPRVSLFTGFVFVWSMPAVFLMEGLSRCGLNRGTFDGTAVAFWRVSAARAVKKPTRGSCSVASDELIGGVLPVSFPLEDTYCGALGGWIAERGPAGASWGSPCGRCKDDA